MREQHTESEGQNQLIAGTREEQYVDELAMSGKRLTECVSILPTNYQLVLHFHNFVLRDITSTVIAINHMRKNRGTLTHTMREILTRWIGRRYSPLLLSVSLALLLSCDESLPPYSVPGVLFKGSIYPEFVKAKSGSALWVFMSVQNTFDETLQDTVQLTGTLEIILARDPTIRKTVTLNQGSLLYHFNTILGFPTYANYPSINSHNILTVNSKDSVSFFYSWNFVDDNNVNLPAGVFVMHRDTANTVHIYASPETFIVQGSVQVFKKVGLVILQPVSYVVNYE